jgi:uncharacterized protein (DUF697 family)
MDVQESEARRIINKYMWWSMGAGLLPFPLVDVAAITGVQLRMLQQLSNNYDVPFHRGRGKKIISVLLGSVIPTSLTYTVGSALKLVPFIGPIIGGISMPIFAGATTYAIGKLFMQHFESGGTFLDLEPARVRAYFRQEFEKGQELASEMRRHSTPTQPNQCP